MANQIPEDLRRRFKYIRSLLKVGVYAASEQCSLKNEEVYIKRIAKAETDCEELRRLLAKMREPVSSEEWEHIGYWSDSSRPETDITHRKDVDRLIAARASAGE